MERKRRKRKSLEIGKGQRGKRWVGIAGGIEERLGTGKDTEMGDVCRIREERLGIGKDTEMGDVCSIREERLGTGKDTE